jgi:hemerythrin
MVLWSEEYCIGIKEIDLQKRKMIKYISKRSKKRSLNFKGKK